MSQSNDAPAAAKNSGDDSFLGKALSETVDFGEGLFHGAIENPVNGVVQLANHVSGAKLPELHLVDEKKVDSTAGGMLGNIAGTVVDVAALTFATGGLGDIAGGAGAAAVTAANVLRLGAIGAAVSGVFTPSDANSKTFFQDRLTNGAIGAGTFAAMGGAGALLDGTGLFATSAARGLASSVTYGGLIGAAGGAANAEGTAVLKEGKALPSAGELATDMATYATFGGLFGAAGYAINKITLPTQTISADGRTAVVTTDQSGAPVKVAANVPSLTSDDRINITTTQMANGLWKTNATDYLGDSDYVHQPTINNVTLNDGKLTMSGPEEVREFNPDGTYKIAYPQEEAAQAQATLDRAAYQAKYHPTEKLPGGMFAGRDYNQNMQLTSLKYMTADEPAQVSNEANLNYTLDKGSLYRVSISGSSSAEGSGSAAGSGDNTMYLTRQADGSWNTFRDGAVYNWKGNINVTPSEGAGHPEQIQFTGADGKASTFDVTQGGKPVQDMINDSATYIPGASGRPVLSVNASGDATFTAGKSDYTLLPATINGAPLAPGETAAIKPGDQITMRVDIGDRGPEYEYRTLIWGKAPDGNPILGTTELKPNSTIDMPFSSGYSIVHPAEATN